MVKVILKSFKVWKSEKYLNYTENMSDNFFIAKMKIFENLISDNIFETIITSLPMCLKNRSINKKNIFIFTKKNNRNRRRMHLKMHQHYNEGNFFFK